MNYFSLYCVFLLLNSINFVKGISEADFYPFGLQNGDSRAPTNDDGSTDPIPVSSLFPFFNHQHDSLIVNTNGVISFLGTMSTYTPSSFPLASYRRLIAPYWTDVDTSNGGDIWYRETTNATILQKASDDIHNVFPEQFNFQASWVFIATWSDVAFFGADSNGKTKRCTFQCLLITNGRHSFTVFLYDKIEWTTGTASGGSSSTGLGGVPAQVGFDAGDGINFFALDASRTSDIINVSTMSNIDVPGKFVFRVDSSSIKQGGCNTNGTLTVTPREATMLGGTRLIISGPCFNITETVSLQMSDGIAVSCKLQTDISVTCISPQVFRTGKEVILLNIIQADDILSFRGTLTIVNQALTKPLLIRNPTSWKYGQTVDIVWRPVQMGFPVDTLIGLDLYTPKVSNNTINNLVYHSFITFLHDDDVAFGIYSFPLDFKVEAGIIKLSSNDSQSPYYWTEMFTVSVNISNSQKICSDWIEQDQEFPLITSEDVSPCPCSLNVVLIDTTRFHVDPSCVNTEASDFDCPYQPSAKACFKQNIPSLKGYDHQCCYDDSGVLMNPNGFDQSGFVNRYHYFGHGYNNIPFLSNFVFDTMPYQHCCVYPSQDFETVDIHIYTLCSSFYIRRPPQSCLNYVPPRTARVSGDPHYATFDGFLYTFNPVGEFVGLANENFIMQLRIEQFGNSQGSAVTAFVAKPFQTADVVEVQPNTIRGLDVIVNGEVIDFDSLISRTLSFDGGTVERIDDERPTIIINFETEGLSIKTFTAVNILNLIILVSPDFQEGDFTGLFGNNDGVKDNELVSRDGNLIESNSSTSDIHNRFGLSWRTLENESLFTYSNGRSHDSYQDYNFSPVIDIPQNIDLLIINECRNNTECIYDYYVTGDQGLGQSSANASRDYDVISNLTVEVITCGFPNNISNAVWIADGYTEGSTAFLTCGNEYYPVDAISSCMTSGYWLEVNVTCIPLPNCGHPPKVTNASWLPGVESNGQTAILMCNDGFYKYDIVQINCTTNNTWRGFEGGFCFQECKDPPYEGGGKWSVEGYRNGSIAVLLCNPGFTSSLTSVTIQCNLNGQWEQANDSCTLETTTSYESSTEYIGSTVVNMSTSAKVGTTVSSNPQTLSELRSTFATTTESGRTPSTSTGQTYTFQTTTEHKSSLSTATGGRSTYLSITDSSTTSNSTEIYSPLETKTESSRSTLSTATEQTSIHQTTVENTTKPTIGPSTSFESTLNFSILTEQTSAPQAPREQTSTQLTTNKTTTTSQTTFVPTTILSTDPEPDTTHSTSTAQASSDLDTREQTSTQLTTNETITTFPPTAVPSSTLSTTMESSSTLSISTELTSIPFRISKTTTTFQPTTVATTTFSKTMGSGTTLSTSTAQTSSDLAIREQTSTELIKDETITNFSTTAVPTSTFLTTTESSSTLSTSTEESITHLSTREQTSTQLTTNETLTSFSTTTVPTTTFSTTTEKSSSLSTSTEHTSYPLSTRKQTSIPLTTSKNTATSSTTTEPISAITTTTESSNTFSTEHSATRGQTSTQLATSTFPTTTVPTSSFAISKESSSTPSTSAKQTSSSQSTAENITAFPPSTESTIVSTTTTQPTSILSSKNIFKQTSTHQTTTEQTNKFPTSTESSNTHLSSTEQTSTSPLTTERITTTPPTTVSTTSKEPKNSLSTTVEQSGTTVTIREETVSILTTKDTIIKFPTTTGFISSLPTSTKTGFRRSTQTSLISTNPVSPDSKGKYASDDDTGNKLTLTITIVSSVVGVLILITIVSIFVACLYRKKKYGTPPNGSMHRSTNMHSDSCSNDSNGWDSFHRNSGPPLYRRSWTFDHKNAFPSFRNLSYLQKDQTDSTEKIDNYHV